VVRHLQHRRSWRSEQPELDDRCFGGPLDVAREEHARAEGLEREDQRVVVLVDGGVEERRAARRGLGPEHIERSGAGLEATRSGQQIGARDRVEAKRALQAAVLVGAGALAVAEPEADREALDDGAEAVLMVGVRVAQRDGVEPPDAQGRERRQHHAPPHQPFVVDPSACIDEQRRPAADPNERGVAVRHVEEVDLHLALGRPAREQRARERHEQTRCHASDGRRRAADPERDHAERRGRAHGERTERAPQIDDGRPGSQRVDRREPSAHRQHECRLERRCERRRYGGGERVEQGDGQQRALEEGHDDEVRERRSEREQPERRYDDRRGQRVGPERGPQPRREPTPNAALALRHGAQDEAKHAEDRQREADVEGRPRVHDAEAEPRERDELHHIHRTQRHARDDPEREQQRRSDGGRCRAGQPHIEPHDREQRQRDPALVRSPREQPRRAPHEPQEQRAQHQREEAEVRSRDRQDVRRAGFVEGRAHLGRELPFAPERERPTERPLRPPQRPLGPLERERAQALQPRDRSPGGRHDVQRARIADLRAVADPAHRRPQPRIRDARIAEALDAMELRREHHLVARENGWRRPIAPQADRAGAGMPPSSLAERDRLHHELPPGAADLRRTGRDRRDAHPLAGERIHAIGQLRPGGNRLCGVQGRRRETRGSEDGSAPDEPAVPERERREDQTHSGRDRRQRGDARPRSVGIPCDSRAKVCPERPGDRQRQ